MKKLLLLTLLLTLTLSSIFAQREITLDFNKEKGAHDKFFKECIGAGRANEGLRADWQKQLLETKAECDFKYIRFHGLFHDDMGVYTEDEEGNPIYNWQYIDVLYDYILEIGMKPFVEMSFMPSDLASGEETVFWWKGNITPPKDYDKWHDFIKAFTQHVSERYGMEEVKSWYFEVWNEPNLNFFFSGTQEEYFKLYKYAVEAVRSVCAEYRVGGPASAGAAWVAELLEYGHKNDVPVDFIATHAYNVQGFLDEFGTQQLRMMESPDDVVNQVNVAREDIDKSELSKAELHFTEWSSSYSPRDPVHDTYQNATFILHTLKTVEGTVNSMSYWVFTDIFEESGVPATPFHGGFGLMNQQGIKKPTYFIYKYLNQLGNTELENDDFYSWACKQDNDVQLLLWDFSYSDQEGKSNQVFYRQKHVPEAKPDAQVSISNMEDGLYSLEIHKTGYKHNDVFTAYYDMGLPSQITRDMEAFLKSCTIDQPVEQKIVRVQDGKFEKNLPLNENDIYLLKLVYLNN